MKLSKQTLEIISAISKINAKSNVNGAVFKKGSRIKARRYKSDAPVMYADIEEEFPKDFAVYDLPKFLAMFNVLEDPDLTFEDDYINFKSGKKKAKFRYVAPHLIENDENFFTKEVKMPSVDFTCEIDKDTMKSIIDATAMFQAPQIAFTTINKKVFLTTYNLRDPRADKFEIEVGESEDWEFNVVVDVSQVQFLRRDYKVSICKRGLIEWASDDIKYYVTISDKSKT